MCVEKQGGLAAVPVFAQYPDVVAAAFGSETAVFDVLLHDVGGGFLIAAN